MKLFFDYDDGRVRSSVNGTRPQRDKMHVLHIETKHLSTDTWNILRNDRSIKRSENLNG